MSHADLTAVVAGNRVAQFGGPRTASFLVVHTSESSSGATVRGLASYIGGRTDRGSYHEIADIEGNTATLVPEQLEAFGSRRWRQGGVEVNVNRKSLHAAFVYRAEDWGTDERERAMVIALGRRLRPIMLRHGIPAERITRPIGAGGVLGHNDTDPDRRTDPGARFPWALFLQTLKGEPMANTDELRKTITSAYNDLAGRLPDPAGMAFWLEALTANPQRVGMMNEQLAREGLARAHRERYGLLRSVAALTARIDDLAANGGQSGDAAPFAGGTVVLRGQLTIEDA